MSEQRRRKERPSGDPCGAAWTISTKRVDSIPWLLKCAGRTIKESFQGVAV